MNRLTLKSSKSKRRGQIRILGLRKKLLQIRLIPKITLQSIQTSQIHDELAQSLFAYWGKWEKEKKLTWAFQRLRKKNLKLVWKKDHSLSFSSHIFSETSTQTHKTPHKQLLIRSRTRLKWSFRESLAPTKSRTLSIASRTELSRLSIIQTVNPSLSSCTTVWVPMNPAPPVTRIVRSYNAIA